MFEEYIQRLEGLDPDDDDAHEQWLSDAADLAAAKSDFASWYGELLRCYTKRTGDTFMLRLS